MNIVQWNFNRNWNIFIQENVLENVVWKMSAILSRPQCVNTLRPRQIGRHLADNIFKCIFLNEDGWIPIKISLKFVPKGRINNTPALIQIMAWCRPGDKPLSEPMMVRLPTHICVSRPQWVNTLWPRHGHDIYNCIFLNEVYEFQLNFHWSLFLRVQLTFYVLNFSEVTKTYIYFFCHFSTLIRRR